MLPTRIATWITSMWLFVIWSDTFPRDLIHTLLIGIIRIIMILL